MRHWTSPVPCRMIMASRILLVTLHLSTIIIIALMSLFVMLPGMNSPCSGNALTDEGSEFLRAYLQLT